MRIEIVKYPDFSDTLRAVKLPFNKEANITYYLDTNEIDKDDIALLSRLVKSGNEHAKAMRGTWVTFKINAPRYWWVEFDTYKIGVQTLSSTSTMHTITKRDLTNNDFERYQVLPDTLNALNKIRNDNSISNKDKLAEMKRILPEGFLQTRIVQINYQALRNIYHQRKKHRLLEWRFFCGIVELLDYFDEFIGV
jgi:hypothetical protein